MLQMLEDENKKGLADQAPEMENPPQENYPPEQTNEPEQQVELKNYMFFSNLKSIKEKVEKLLSMDASQIDSMLEDGHDWASDHVATSKDDIEEVYNWITGESS